MKTTLDHAQTLAVLELLGWAAADADCIAHDYETNAATRNVEWIAANERRVRFNETLRMFRQLAEGALDGATVGIAESRCSQCGVDTAVVHPIHHLCVTERPSVPTARELERDAEGVQS